MATRDIHGLLLQYHCKILHSVLTSVEGGVMAE